MAKTPTVKPSKPQVPLLSSTPAVNPSVAAEGKDRFVFSLPTREQEKEAGVDDDDGSASEEESETDGDEPHEDEQELEQLTAASRVPAASVPGFSLGGTTFVPASSATGKGVFSAAVAKDEAELKKPAAQPVRLVAPDRLQDKPTPLPTASGAFSAVGKPAGSQAALNTTQAEPPKASASFSLPATEEQVQVIFRDRHFIQG